MDNDVNTGAEMATDDVIRSSNSYQGIFRDESEMQVILNEMQSEDQLITDFEEEEDATPTWNEDFEEAELALEGAMDFNVDEAPQPRRIIGTVDSRKKVRQVGNTKKVPFRWLCYLSSFFRDPDDPGRVVELPGGTGLLIGPNHVLTAAHVVYAEVTGSRGTKKKQKALRTKVYVGRDGSDSTAIAQTVSLKYAYPSAFTKDLDVRWDYAVIKLKDKVGLRKYEKIGGQVLGYWGSSKWGQNTFIKALKTSYLKTQIVNVAGYPKFKGGLQYIAFDSVKDAPPTVKGTPIRELITYLVDTSEGQSGAPVWKYIKSSGKRYLVAVHYGSCVAALDGCIKSGKVTKNLGALITPTVVKQIKTWIKTM